MKKLVLLLLTSFFLSLDFTSCIQEDIAGDCYTKAYILIPKEYKISAPFEKEKDNDYSQFLELKGYYNSNFKNKIENNNNEYKLFSKTDSPPYELNKNMQRKFRKAIVFEITGTLNGKETSEIVNFVVEIPNLEIGFNCCEFQIETKKFGNVDLLYKYFFDPVSKNTGPEMDRDFYILIPKEYKISAPFKEKTDEDYAHFLSHSGYYRSNFESKVKNNNNEYKLFYSLPKHYYKNSLTRRKFTEKIEFKITGTINGEEISEIVNFVVKIPYLLSDYNCSEFRVKTKNFGIINLLYLYYFN